MKIELKVSFYDNENWDFWIPGQEYILVNNMTSYVIKNESKRMEEIYEVQTALKRFHSRFFKRFP